MNKLEEEFRLYDETSAWSGIYQKIRRDSMLQHDFSVKDAKRPEYKERNRYRDVSPYDHSRVRLERNHLDYINASLVEYPEANRSYILTQGPLPKTSSHFWLMVWEQNSRAVLMLNRVVEMGRGPLPHTAGHFWLLIWESNSAAILMLNRIVEKGQIKCHQYFPTNIKDKEELLFEDVGLRVSYVSEEDANFYVIRTLEIEDLESGKKKQVLQFHYTTWPDFGVPESPEAFLHFLFAVRKAGVLQKSVGPAVIHCSAGIGRSGTFCLVDTCLILIEKSQDPNSVSVCDVLMEMRQYRMGLIQTADQLRFSYMAIIEGCKHVLKSTSSTVISGNDNKAVHQSSDGEVSSLTSLSSEEELSMTQPSGDLITGPLSPNDNNNPPVTKLESNDVSHSPGHVPDGHKDNHVCVADSTAVDSWMTNESDELTEDTDNISNEKLMKETLEEREQSAEIRRRRREERKKKTAEQIARMKKKQQECEKWKLRRKQFTPYLWGISVAVLIASFMIYKYYVT